MFSHCLLLILLVSSIYCVQQQFLSFDISKEYRLRVKQPLSCERITQYSGYIDNLITNEHTFFYFFPSRFSPEKDPVILWVNGGGGVGCSSMTGVWLEAGPCLVEQGGNSTEINVFSFNNIANMLYIDAPSGTGYSYGSNTYSTSEQVAASIYQFLQFFFTEFKDYSDNEFHLAGSSYAGHFIPSLAKLIVQKNRYAAQQGRLYIPLQSVMIGNGFFNYNEQQLSYADYSCSTDSKYQPLFDKYTCRNLYTAKRRCEYLLNNCRRSFFSCYAARMYCKSHLADPFQEKKLNPSDIRRKCNGKQYCSSVMDDIERYANRQDVRQELGVDKQAGPFQYCKECILTRFKLSDDYQRDSSQEVAHILSSGIRVLIFSGDMNWENNWYGQMRWLSKLDWYGQVHFNDAMDTDWYSYVSGQKAGKVRTFDSLTFVKVYDAGQFAIHDQPASTIDMFSRWIMQRPFN